MGKNFDEKDSKQVTRQSKKGKSFQELSDEVSTNPHIKERQPTPQPKDFDEIEY